MQFDVMRMCAGFWTSPSTTRASDVTDIEQNG